MSEKTRTRLWIRSWEEEHAPSSGLWAQRRRLAAAMRRVIELLTTSDAPEAELAIAADRLDQYAEHLAGHPKRKRYEGVAESATAGPRSPLDSGGHFDWSPLIGRANPLAPPVRIRSDEDGRVHARVTFGTPYEGAPGCLHGGYVSAALDEVLGYAQALTGNPGMTGTLTVRYRNPTPLHVELRIEACVEKVEGRKIFAHGTIHAGETLCAEADGIFISVSRERFEALAAARRTGDVP